MPFRVSTLSNFTRVLSGLRMNQSRMIRAQEQLASGRRLLRPSDDPNGMSRSLALSRRLAGVERGAAAIVAGKREVDTAASILQDAGAGMTEARAILIQGMNGTLSQGDRASLAIEIDFLRNQLLEYANSREGESYLFGGTRTNATPWREVNVGGLSRIVYDGNRGESQIRVGEGVDLTVNLAGEEVFGRDEPTVTRYGGLTGAATGLTADEGSGYEYLKLRHDSTNAGAIGTVGLALVNGGGDDSILGANALTIDPVASTIQLGTGPVVSLPSAADPNAADFIVENELGAELHLDFSAYTGAAYTGTVTGNGSISLDGTNYVTLDFLDTDLELSHPATGSVIHVDTTGIRRAENDLVSFGGRVNVFDMLQGIAEDLRNADGLDTNELVSRLSDRLIEFDRNHDNILAGTGVLGARSQRLQSSEDRAIGREVQIRGLISDIEDADLAEVALDLANSELVLSVTQAAGARLIQTSLLNYLR